MHTAVFPNTAARLLQSDADRADAFRQLARSHQSLAFQITFGLLLDESTAETITRQVFQRLRRQLARGVDATAATVWIYRASLRFACRHYWKTTPPAIRGHVGSDCRDHIVDFNLDEFIHVLALHPGRIDAHDCKLITLRHILGLSLPHIGELLHMHPYEISNRLIWSLERVKEIHHNASHRPHVA